jgi:hypothetical protein
MRASSKAINENGDDFQLFNSNLNVFYAPNTVVGIQKRE